MTASPLPTPATPTPGPTPGPTPTRTHAHTASRRIAEESMRLPVQRRGVPPAPEAPNLPDEGEDRLHRLNSSSTAEAESTLLACCGSRRWARRLAAHRPYPDHEALLAAAEEACYDLSPADLAEALSRESTQSPVPDGPGARAAHTALRAAHAAYETRFGHAFTLCLDDVPPEHRLDRFLSSIRARLGHHPDHEREVAAEELRHLARARLARLSGAVAPRA